MIAKMAAGFAGKKYTQVNSKVGNLARKRRKFLSPERATLAYGKARVRTKNLLPS